LKTLHKVVPMPERRSSLSKRRPPKKPKRPNRFRERDVEEWDSEGDFKTTAAEWNYGKTEYASTREVKSQERKRSVNQNKKFSQVYEDTAKTTYAKAPRHSDIKNRPSIKERTQQALAKTSQLRILWREKENEERASTSSKLKPDSYARRESEYAESEISRNVSEQSLSVSKLDFLRALLSVKAKKSKRRSSDDLPDRGILGFLQSLLRDVPAKSERKSSDQPSSGTSKLEFLRSLLLDKEKKKAFKPDDAASIKKVLLEDTSRPYSQNSFVTEAAASVYHHDSYDTPSSSEFYIDASKSKSAYVRPTTYSTVGSNISILKNIGKVSETFNVGSIISRPKKDGKVSDTSTAGSSISRPKKDVKITDKIYEKKIYEKSQN